MNPDFHALASQPAQAVSEETTLTAPIPNPPPKRETEPAPNAGPHRGFRGASGGQRPQRAFRLRRTFCLPWPAVTSPSSGKPATEYTGGAPRTHHRADTGTEAPPWRTMRPAPHGQADPEGPGHPTERAHGKEASSTVRKRTVFGGSQHPKAPRTQHLA
jgi:hypothetical protein